MGAGRSEVARAIFGIDDRDAGRVVLNGAAIPPGSPTASMAAGMGFVPEDRRQQGLVMPMAIDHNIALPSLSRLSSPRGSSAGRPRCGWPPTGPPD